MLNQAFLDENIDDLQDLTELNLSFHFINEIEKFVFNGLHNLTQILCSMICLSS